MRRQRGHGPGAQVARDTNFEGNVFGGQVRHQRRIFNGADSMADAFRTDFKGFPYAGRTRSLACVTSQAQASIPRLAVKIREQAGGPTLFIAAQPDRDHSFTNTLGCEIENWFGWIGAKLTDSIENPANGEAAARGFPCERVVDRGKILLLPQTPRRPKESPPRR